MLGARDIARETLQQLVVVGAEERLRIEASISPQDRKLYSQRCQLLSVPPARLELLPFPSLSGPMLFSPFGNKSCEMRSSK